LTASNASGYPALNATAKKYGDKITVLGVPCNQFGLQENSSEEEILPTLKYVRPGNGFAPAFPLTGAVKVNGDDAHPLFKWIKEQCPKEEAGEGPIGGKYLTDTTPKGINAVECAPEDFQWNFDKVLIAGDGERVFRFAPNVPLSTIEKRIDELLAE